jgi:hypothetical protein
VQEMVPFAGMRPAQITYLPPMALALRLYQPPDGRGQTVTLTDELTELHAKIETARAVIDSFTHRMQVSTSQSYVDSLRRERARLQAECLNLRLARMYKIEDNWEAIIAALGGRAQ